MPATPRASACDPYFLSSSGDAGQPDALAAIRAWTAGWLDSLDKQDALIASGALRRLQVPVSVIFGERDRYLSSSLAAELSQLFTDASMHLVRDATHYPQHEQPEVVLIFSSGLPNRHPARQEVEMHDSGIGAQYSTGLSRYNIEQALLAAGKNLDGLQSADLGPLEDFHTGLPPWGRLGLLGYGHSARPARPGPARHEAELTAVPVSSRGRMPCTIRLAICG